MSVRQDVGGVEQLRVIEPAHGASVLVRDENAPSELLLVDPLADRPLHVRPGVGVDGRRQVHDLRGGQCEVALRPVVFRHENREVRHIDAGTDLA